MVVFSDGSVKLSEELSAMIPGIFANKAGFLEQNFKSQSPGIIISCFACSESNALGLRGDWETLKQAHDILENWMEKQMSALFREQKDEAEVDASEHMPINVAVANEIAVATVPLDTLCIKPSSVKIITEETLSDVTVDVKKLRDINNDIKEEETVSPNKSKKEASSCLDSLSLTEIPKCGSAVAKCPNENKLCRKRRNITPCNSRPRLGMNLRKRIANTVVNTKLKENHSKQEKTTVAAVSVNCSVSGDEDVSVSAPDWQPEEAQSKCTIIVNASDNKDKVIIASKKTTKESDHHNEMSIQQPGTSDDYNEFDPAPIKCKNCSYATNSNRNLRHHMRRRHLERKFRCTECDKVFGLGKDLREHMRSHSKQVTCDVCGKKFTRNYFLQKHFANKHVAKKEKPEKQKPQKKPERPLVYGCKQCDYIGKTARNLRNHETRTHGEKTLPCPTCNKTFAMMKDLKQHVRTHTQRFCCEVCGKALKSKFALQLHRNSIHLGIKNTYVKHYLCTICGKMYNNKTVYREHQNKEHLGVRPFACEECDAAFFAKSSLRVHRRIHSDVRSHMCDICGKAFKGTQSLRLHQNIHRQWRPHKCEECNKKFTQKGALVRHMRIHTGERPFKCRLCSASFNDYSILRRHLMGIHKLTDGKYQRQLNVGTTDEKSCVIPICSVEADTSTTVSRVANTAAYTTGDSISPNNQPMMPSTQELSEVVQGAAVAAPLQCDHQTDLAQLQHNIQLSLPSTQATHAAVLRSSHDCNAIMHSVHGNELQSAHYDGMLSQQAAHNMGMVTISIQDHGQVVTAAHMQPELDQQLTAAVQEAAHTLVHDVGRVSLTHVASPNLALNQSHDLGLPVRLLPELQMSTAHMMPQQDVGTQGVHPQMCNSKIMGRDAGPTENYTYT